MVVGPAGTTSGDLPGPTQTASSGADFPVAHQQRFWLVGRLSLFSGQDANNVQCSIDLAITHQ